MATDAERLVILLEVQSKKLQNSLVDVNRQIDRFAAQTEKRFDLMQKKTDQSFASLSRSVQSSMGTLSRAIAPVVGGLGLREVLNYGDAWILAGNKIAAAGQISGLQARSLDELKESANGARASFEEYVDLYSRLIRSSATIGATELEVAKATDVVAKALKAGSQSAQEQTASLIQLGQALGSGVLQGDELRSIRENAPLVASAIAKEFGVTIGELKALGAEGKLTSDRVFKALLNGAEDIEAAFAKTQSTVKDAFSRIENEFIAYIGNADAAQGATRGLIDALNFLATNFTEIADVVIQFAAVLIGAFAGKAIVGGIGSATVALGALLTALRAGTLGAATFTAALGPIGLLAGAAAAAILLLNYNQGDAARAAEAHSEALATNQEKLGLAVDASQAFREALQKQIALQLSAAEAALAEAEAQKAASQSKKDLQGLLPEVMAAIPQPFGKVATRDQVEARKAEYNSRIDAESNARINAAKQRVADLRRQLAEGDAILATTPGTGDLAGDGKGSGSGSGKAKGDSQWQNALDGINKRTAALQAQTAAQSTLNPLVNDYGFAMEKAKAASDLLQAAQDANITITPELRASIDALATTYATATVEADKMAESQQRLRAGVEQLRDIGKDAFKSFIDDIRNGISVTEALGNSLNKVADKLLDIGLDAVFGGGSGKDFGLIGKLFGFKDGGIAANGRPQPLRKFASGGTSSTAAIFGEARPEAAVPLPDGRSIPVDLRLPKSGGSSAGGASQIIINIDAKGAEIGVEEKIAKAMRQQVPAMIKAMAPGAVKQANAGRTG